MEETTRIETDPIKTIHKKKRQNNKFILLTAVVLVIAIAMAVSTVSFYRSLQVQLFAERQSHLIEMTRKVSEVINTTIEAVQREVGSARELIEYTEIEDENAVYPALQDMVKMLNLKDGVLLAIDNSGRYYSSEQKTGYWENLGDLLSDHSTPKIRDLPVNGEKQDCMVFFRDLDEPKPMGKGGNTISHVAIALPMSSMKDTFSLSIFNDSCLTYLVSSNGRRLYRNVDSAGFIEQINVLAELQEEIPVMGGTMEELMQAVANGETMCMEFEDETQLENYFVSTVPVSKSEWTLLLFVPTKALGAYTSSSMSLVILYFAGIAVGFVIICGCLLFTVLSDRNNREMMAQQEENNRLLAKAAEEARSASTAKSEFLSHMSHDIRTPINGIIGMTNIAIKSENDPARVADCLHKISGATDHLLTLVNDVLDMSRIESGKVTIAHDPIDIRTVIDGCVSIIDGQLLSRHVKFEQEFDKIVHPFLLGDALHLRQVFINILGNSVKFTPDGGTITFRAEELSDTDGQAHYRFVFADTGIGMSEEFQKKIFEPFSQEDGGSRTTYKGTGLGMAITKQFVDMMDGTITLESHQGAGSCFTVELDFPIDQEHSVEEPETEEVSLAGMRVLLVEDNELNMEIAQELLEDEGIKVVTAENGQIGADTFLKEPENTFDVILMDVMMPVLNGYEATKLIRSSNHPEAKTIPIVAMTANAYDEDIKAALSAGMNDHVAKPIELERLFSVLNHYKKEKNP